MQRPPPGEYDHSVYCPVKIVSFFQVSSLPGILPAWSMHEELLGAQPQKARMAVGSSNKNWQKGYQLPRGRFFQSVTIISLVTIICLIVWFILIILLFYIVE